MVMLLQHLTIFHSYTTPQPKPLSDEEIIKLFWDASWGTDEDVVKFARAIEKGY